jgi:hypothetical protein
MTCLNNTCTTQLGTNLVLVPAAHNNVSTLLNSCPLGCWWALLPRQPSAGAHTVPIGGPWPWPADTVSALCKQLLTHNAAGAQVHACTDLHCQCCCSPLLSELTGNACALINHAWLFRQPIHPPSPVLEATSAPLGMGCQQQPAWPCYSMRYSSNTPHHAAARNSCRIRVFSLQEVPAAA